MDQSDRMAHLEALLERFDLSADERRPASPVVTALEAAVLAEERGLLGPFAIALKAVELCPPNATGFERGMAFGMALALNSEPVEDEARVERRKPDLRIVR